jgi:hypothetical protein
MHHIALIFPHSAPLLTPDVLAYSLEEIAAIQAEVDDDALTRVIKTLKNYSKNKW